MQVMKKFRTSLSPFFFFLTSHHSVKGLSPMSTAHYLNSAASYLVCLDFKSMPVPSSVLQVPTNYYSCKLSQNMNRSLQRWHKQTLKNTKFHVNFALCTPLKQTQKSLAR